MSNMPNPFKLKKTKALQKALGIDTLTGGTEGSAENQTSAVSSVEPTPSAAASMGTALDALSAMFCGYVGQDRELLDSGFEDLVGILEEWRDAVPKAPSEKA